MKQLSQKVRNEIWGLDILRFLCAFSVVCGHYFSSLPPADYFLSGFSNAGVAVFFVISGFIIPQSSEGKSPYRFIQSRAIRLVPAVWICATITLTVLIIESAATRELLGKWLRTVLFIPVVPWKIEKLEQLWIDTPYWTLFVGIAFYSLILLLLITNRFKLLPKVASWLGALSVAYWTVYFLCSYVTPDLPISHFIRDTGYKRYLDLALIHHGAWFGVGINIWLIANRRGGNRVFSFVICLVGGLMQVIHNDISHNEPYPLKSILFCVIGIGLIWLSIYIYKIPRLNPENFSRFCRWIGLTTYPLYLFHNAVGLYLISILSRNYAIDPIASIWITIAFVTSFSFFIAYVLEPRLQAMFRTKFNAMENFLRERHFERLTNETTSRVL